MLVVTVAAVVWAGPVSLAKAATTERVSVSSQGAGGHKGSSVVAITPDGGYVLFNSDSGDLIPPDHNHCSDVFVRDRTTHKTFRVSIRSDGVGVNGCSYGGATTPDGRYVVFASDATNVVPGLDTNGHRWDVYLRDRQRGRTTRLSVRTDGRQFDSSGVSEVGADVEMQVSDNGRFVSFSVEAGFHFHAYVRDRARRVTIHRINALPVGMSPKGQYVAIEVGGSFDEAHALILRDIAHSSSIKISALLPSFALPYSGRVFVTRRARHVAFTAGRHAYVYTHRSNRATVVPTPNGRETPPWQPASATMAATRASSRSIRLRSVSTGTT